MEVAPVGKRDSSLDRGRLERGQWSTLRAADPRLRPFMPQTPMPAGGRALVRLRITALLLALSLHIGPQASPQASLGAWASERPNHTYSLYLQPYPGTRVSVDGKEQELRLVSRDNSLALVQFSHSQPQLDAVVSRPDYSSRMLRLDPEARPFVVLDRTASGHRFVASHPTGSQPKSVTFIDDRRVIIPLLNDRGIDVIDILSGERRRIAPPEAWSRRIGFVEALVLAHRNEVWVSQMTTAAIHVFDLHSLDYKLTIQTGGAWSKVLAYNPVLDRVFYTHWISEDVSIIDPYSYREEERVNYRAVPRGLGFSADGGHLYLAQYELEGRAVCQVLKINLDTLAVEARLGSLGAKRHIVMDHGRGRMYVSDMARNLVEVYGLADDSLLASLQVDHKPNTIQLSPDGRFLYVSCRGPNNPDRGYLYKGYQMGSLYVIDTDSLSVFAAWEGGNQPTGLDVSPDGRWLVFSDFLDHRIRVYRRGDLGRLQPAWWCPAMENRLVLL